MNDILQYYLHTTLGRIELIASVLTLVCVFQVAQQSIWNFLWGGIAVILYGYIFYKSKLFADTVLQWGYYLPIQVYGWWYWYYKGIDGHNTLHPSPLNQGEQVLITLMLILFTIVAGLFFANYTTASFPFYDSFIMVTSIVAQYLLSKKFSENWILWIMVDIVAIPLYYAKGLYVTSGLYVILLCMCIYGLYQWVDDEFFDEVEE